MVRHDVNGCRFPAPAPGVGADGGAAEESRQVHGVSTRGVADSAAAEGHARNFTRLLAAGAESGVAKGLCTQDAVCITFNCLHFSG